eukprot:gnl/TRDRNA2_/TRDRNA2_145922_c2_seq1.p1 gnl/TRDRNA2_/TRDRNA2_145922_c2~~gnl/TRDRNA2_/TRDRNA2_145922_c2_seq1.p1  ORF type:complete len:326 (-),score=46.24 gnl/TRDRNA2_/TRDRNA2_145922_c2_seq1:48-1025(-)
MARRAEVNFGPAAKPQTKETCGGFFGVGEFLAGGLASCTSKICTMPLSRLGLLMQVQAMPSKSLSAPVARPVFWNVAREILKREGILGLWRGNTAALLHCVPCAGVIFAITGACKRTLEQEVSCSASVRSVVAGASGAVVGVAAAHPLDVVKTRVMAWQPGACPGQPVGVFRTLWRIGTAEGFRGCYRGLGASLLGSVPSVALKFALFDLCLEVFQHGTESQPQTWQVLCAGGASGATVTAIFYPFDLVKRQLQLGEGRTAVCNGFCDTVRQIYNAGAAQASNCCALAGLGQFYYGLTPVLLRVVPGIAIMFTVNDLLLSVAKPA